MRNLKELGFKRRSMAVVLMVWGLIAAGRPILWAAEGRQET